MIASQSTTVATAAAFRPAENSAVADVRASGRTVRPKITIVRTLIATSVILSQNDSAVNSRTGSPTINVPPVNAITTRPPHIQGANRLQTAANGSSARTLPTTLSVIITLE